MAVFGNRAVTRGGAPSEGELSGRTIGGISQSLSMDLEFKYKIPDQIQSSEELMGLAAREASRDRQRIEAWARRVVGPESQAINVDRLKLVHSEFHTNSFYHALLGLSSSELAVFQDTSNRSGDELRAVIDARLKDKEDPIHKAWIRFKMKLRNEILIIDMSDSGPGPAPTQEAFDEKWKRGLRHLNANHGLTSEESGRGLALLAYFMDGKGEIEFTPRTEFIEGFTGPYLLRITQPLTR